MINTSDAILQENIITRIDEFNEQQQIDNIIDEMDVDVIKETSDV